MKKNYVIATPAPDIRILSTLEVEGKTQEECDKKANKKFDTFIEELELYEE